MDKLIDAELDQSAMVGVSSASNLLTIVDHTQGDKTMRGLVVALFVSVVAVCPAVAAPESTSISINFAAEAGSKP